MEYQNIVHFNGPMSHKCVDIYGKLIYSKVTCPRDFMVQIYHILHHIYGT